MKLQFGLLSTVYGASKVLPGQCPELPNQENFDTARYLGLWQTHYTNDDQNIPEGVSCTVANYRATGRDDTIRVLNTSTDDNDNFRFADGTGVQKSTELPNQFFVSFTEVGSCDSYDQYAYDQGNCNAFNRPPVLPDQESDYLQVIETDYDNYALVSFCEDIDDDSHKETLYILVRSQSCWANLNKDFVENKLDYMEDLGLYIDNMRYISQENCDDGIVRPQCDGTDKSNHQAAIIWLENAFEKFAQNLFYAIVDFLFYLLQY